MVRFSDLELIKLLQKDSHISYVDLAKKFNVTETAIRKRIHSLEEKKVIKGYSVEIDYKKIGFDVCALIGIDTVPEKLVTFMEQMKQEDAICIYYSSGDHMLMIEKCFKNTRELVEYVQKLENTKGITKVCPAIIMDKLK